jgi:nitrous oxidase accessory protein NosD
LANPITGFDTKDGVAKYDYNALANRPEDGTGTIISGNADYAEVGEWEDGNPDAEERLGYFVAIAAVEDNTIKIRKATSEDDVKGVTVFNPAFSGNAAAEKYISDGVLYPQYSYVGLMGIVSVIDNGTCTVGGRCMPADDGTAVPSSNNMGYGVLERIDASHVLIAVEPGADMIQRIKTDIKDIENKIKNGDFDGKSAYQYAKEGGYEGSEAEFAEDTNPDNIKVFTIVSTLTDLRTAIAKNNKHIAIAKGANFSVNEEINVPANTTIIGSGATITRATGFEGKLFYLNQGCRLQDLTIDGNRTAMTNAHWDKTIEIATYGNCMIDNVTINNGNECIILYGNDNVVQNCNISNCGGNGIHFSGGKRSRILNNTIINSNLTTSPAMGHEGGCISWSAECEDVTAIGNWLENGLAGFGFIGGEDNSRIKIIGNTVKNCNYGVEAIFTTLKPVKNVIIQSNHFIDNGAVSFNNTDNKAPALINGVIDGNVFENTTVTLRNVASFVVSNNIMRCDETVTAFGIHCQNSARANISNNNIVLKGNAIGIYIYENCANVSVVGNYVRTKKYGIYTNTSNNVVIDNNVFRMIYNTQSTDTFLCMDGSKNIKFTNNEIVTYKKGADIGAYATVLNNTVLLADTTKTGLRVPSGATNTIIKNNRSNVAVTVNESTAIQENNDLGLYDDIFVGLTMNLTNLTSDVPAKVTKGDEFEFVLSPVEGCTLPSSITVTNNGVTCIISDYEYDSSTGKGVIYSVAGDVVITATANGTPVTPEPSYTNVLTLDTTVYKVNKYWSNSGGVWKDDSANTAVVIAVPPSAFTIRIRNTTALATNHSNVYIGTGVDTLTGGNLGMATTIFTADANGDLVYYDANTAGNTYIAIPFLNGVSAETDIITVNEEIPT